MVRITEKYTLREVDVKGVVGKALHVIIPFEGGRGEELYLPLSQLVSYTDTEVVMSDWIAKQKGLI